MGQGKGGSWEGVPIGVAWSFVIFLVMDAEDAFGGDPLFALRDHEFPYPFVPDEFEVFDFTHAVFRAVAVIQVPEPLAGKLRAIAAEFSGAFPAEAQAAVRTGPVLFEISAAAAGVLLPQVRLADAAVHPTRGD